MENLEKPRANWPICYPVIRHDILHDVEGGGMKLVVFVAYVEWYAFWVALFWNAFVMGAVLVLNFGLTYVVGFLLSLLYFCCMPWLALVSYRFVYSGWVPMYWCALFVKLLFQIFLAVGIPETGGSGLIVLLSEWGSHPLIGYFLLANILLWVFMCLLDVALAVAAHFANRAALRGPARPKPGQFNQDWAAAITSRGNNNEMINNSNAGGRAAPSALTSSADPRYSVAAPASASSLTLDQKVAAHSYAVATGDSYRPNWNVEPSEFGTSGNPFSTGDPRDDRNAWEEPI